MKSRLLAGVAAVVLAIIGAVLMFTYAQGADQRAVQNMEPVGVLVVKTAIPAGTPVEAIRTSVAIEQLPGASVTKSSLRSLDGITGKVASVDLVPGEQLVEERLVAPEELKVSGSVKVPAGLQEVSFQLEPQRVVGGRIMPGDHVGVFISMEKGGIEAKADKETTQFSVHKALVTAVQRAPEAPAAAQPAPTAGATPSANPRDSTLPTGSLMLTVAVNDVDAAKIIFASEFATIWLTREPLDAQDNGPRIFDRTEVYK